MKCVAIVVASLSLILSASAGWITVTPLRDGAMVNVDVVGAVSAVRAEMAKPVTSYIEEAVPLNGEMVNGEMYADAASGTPDINATVLATETTTSVGIVQGTINSVVNHPYISSASALSAIGYLMQAAGWADWGKLLEGQNPFDTTDDSDKADEPKNELGISDATAINTDAVVSQRGNNNKVAVEYTGNTPSLVLLQDGDGNDFALVKAQEPATE